MVFSYTTSLSFERYESQRHMHLTKNIHLSILLLLLFCSSACDDGENAPSDITQATEELGIQYAVFELVVNDVESLTFDVLSELEKKDPSGSINTHLPDIFFYGRGSCAQISYDYDLNTIVVDFKNGCLDNKGIFREGKINIFYENARIEPGDEIKVDFDGFKFRNQELNGNLVILKQPNENFATKYDISFQALELTTGNSNLVMDGVRNLELYFHNVGEEILLVNKSGQGTFNGKEFTFSSQEKSRYSAVCYKDNVYLPLGGIDQIIFDETNFNLDYVLTRSNGSANRNCDHLFRIIETENSVTQIDLSPFLSQ